MSNAPMPPLYVDFLNRLDIEELRMTDAEIIAAIETSLAAQGRGETVIEPRMRDCRKVEARNVLGR